MGEDTGKAALKGAADLTFGEWLSRTRDLQRSAYDVDPVKLEREARATYTRWNVLAATAELHEFLQEVRWKPWAMFQGDIPDRPAAVGELVDVMHFIANLLVMLSVDGEELTQRYLDKMEVNAERQDGGRYDEETAKCPSCGRDLEEAGGSMTVSGKVLCTNCLTAGEAGWAAP